MAKTVALKGDFVRKEREASAAITPGDLIEVMSTGNVRVHATIGGAGQKAFALENDLIGKGITDAYAAADLVQYGVFQNGAEVNARLVAGESCSIGDFLESAGDGTLQVASTPIEGSSMAMALEAITGSGSVQRVKVEVL